MGHHAATPAAGLLPQPALAWSRVACPTAKKEVDFNPRPVMLNQCAARLLLLSNITGLAVRRAALCSHRRRLSPPPSRDDLPPFRGHRLAADHNSSPVRRVSPLIPHSHLQTVRRQP